MNATGIARLTAVVALITAGAAHAESAGHQGPASLAQGMSFTTARIHPRGEQRPAAGGRVRT